MAEVANAVPSLFAEDDDQWLYGDEKDGKQNGEVTNEDEGSKSGLPDSQESTRTADDSSASKGSAEQTEPASEGDKSRDEDAEESSDEDDVTVTIGELKKGPDIIQGSGHQPRFQPKTAPASGLRDEDFTGVGKINGVAVFDFSLTDLEEKPWRKPGADISDYFNYGFNEESWFKYCERQKRMRVSESGAGLSGLGINISKPYGSSTHTQSSGPKGFKAGVPRRGAENSTEGETKTEGNTIQVMTADRREYSCKVMNQHQHMSHSRTCDDMDFGGNPYGSSYYSTPPPYFATPPPPYGPWSQPPPPINIPPPAAPWTRTPTSVPPPPPPAIPPPISVAAQPPVVYHSEDSMGSRVSVDPDEDRYRSRRGHRDRERSRDRDRDRDRRSVSKTPSSRHRRRSRSRTPSPSHRHKRKKSKRDRDDD